MTLHDIAKILYLNRREHVGYVNGKNSIVSVTFFVGNVMKACKATAHERNLTFVCLHK